MKSDSFELSTCHLHHIQTSCQLFPFAPVEADPGQDQLRCSDTAGEGVKTLQMELTTGLEDATKSM